MASHHPPQLIIDNTHRVVIPDAWQAEHLRVAMPSARAGRPSARAVLRRLGNSATIAIAVFCVVYFGLQLVRGAL
jgi:hypothetical protein